MKRAIYLLVIAAVLIFSDWLSRARWGAAVHDSDTTIGSALTLTLNPQRSGSNGIGVALQFRLANQGEHSIYYPLCGATDAPVGQIFYRAPQSTGWTVLSQNLQKCQDENLAWIEMPPGGWVEGKFLDPGVPHGEHAFALQIRTRPEITPTSILSDPYRIPQ